MECPICMKEIRTNEQVQLLPKCDHSFHTDCITPWLQLKNFCPICGEPHVNLSSTETSNPNRSMTEISEVALEESCGGSAEPERRDFITAASSGLMSGLQSVGRCLEKHVASYVPAISHKVSTYELQPGDHIYTYRAAGLYSHHGIYIDDFQVIHFNGDPGTSMLRLDARIQKDSLTEFLMGTSIRRYKYGSSREEHFMKRKGTCCRLEPDDVDTVISRAIHCYENQDVPCYHVIKFNCEHFALYCKLGERILELGEEWLGQVQEVLSIPLYPFKLVGAALHALDSKQKKAKEKRRVYHQNNVPVDQRFLVIKSADAGPSTSGGMQGDDSHCHCCSPVSKDRINETSFADDEVVFVRDATPEQKHELAKACTVPSNDEVVIVPDAMPEQTKKLSKTTVVTDALPEQTRQSSEAGERSQKCPRDNFKDAGSGGI